jgi:hypothetical protein
MLLNERTGQAGLLLLLGDAVAAVLKAGVIATPIAPTGDPILGAFPFSSVPVKHFLHEILGITGKSLPLMPSLHLRGEFNVIRGVCKAL